MPLLLSLNYNNNQVYSWSHTMPDSAPPPNKKMGLWAMLCQAFSLLAQIQNMKHFSEAADQLEKNMLPVIIAGIIAIILFLIICLGAAHLALYSAKL